MRLGRTLFIFFTLFFFVQAQSIADLVQQYESTAERMCVSINANRVNAMLTLNVLNQFTTSYMDGFFDCETRNSNTDGTGIGYFGMSSTYGFGGQLGKFGKQTFLGIASLFS